MGHPTIRDMTSPKDFIKELKIFDEFLRIYFGNKLKSNMIVKYNWRNLIQLFNNNDDNDDHNNF